MGGDARQAGGLGLREGEMKLVSKTWRMGRERGRADMNIGLQGDASCVYQFTTESVL